ncbi:MAG: 3-phosphoshikimate 1-carboxyvinyltransferase [Fibrobacter sp.]|nr:3-phosphoshikimate 1-carboxyvinyltransferase [Fibrobacter sp.]
MNKNPSSPTFLEIRALDHIQGEIRLPGSKSITNRALLLASLAQGETRLHHLLWSDDTRYMAESLEKLGVQGMHFSADYSEAVIPGQNGRFSVKNAELFVGNSGTSIRFLTAAVALGQGDFTLTGIERMKERPIRDLIDALVQVGAKIDYTENAGYPPIVLHANGLQGEILHIKGNISSQYLTAILLSAPCMQKPLKIVVDGELISKPYVTMTLRMMQQFGVEVKNLDFKEFHVPNTGYISPGDYDVEGDASSASYALAAAAISDGPVRLLGLDEKSMQGDIHFADVLAEMGAKISYGKGFVESRRGEFPLKAIDKDLSSIPDAAMTVAALCLFANGTSTIRGIHSWKVKETDRIQAMANELRKAGAEVSTTDDSITITPPNVFKTADFETYNDHRMAMCMSLVAFGLEKGKSIRILDPLCVNKTYPGYWKDLKTLTGANFEIPRAK